ncbi:MAG: sulfite oxidase-like oxidoreductase [Gemmatimonas sp.]
MVTRGFWGRRTSPENAKRIPPGQHEEFDFPVLSAGPTPRVSLSTWKFTLRAGVRPVRQWTWEEFNALPRTSITTDIHCVTTWTKLDTQWEGVLIDDIFKAADFVPTTPFVLVHSVDGYSTNVPVADLIDGKAMVALQYDGQPLEPDHGGPARLLVPHLYFWKSAKWVSGLQFIEKDTAGFWELRGYHMYGDPWRQQRFTDD